MSARQLPEKPDLAQLRRLAKELRDAARAGDPAAVERVARHVRTPEGPPPLAVAQLVIAREHGFPSWPRLKAAVEGATPSLHDAVEANDVALVRLLLRRGAELGDGHTLEHAAAHPDHECLRLLIEHGARVRGTGVLAGAVGRDDLDGVRILLAAGADPGRPHPAGSAPAGLLPENPLTAAVQRGSADAIEVLLDAGADPDATCRDGRSALRTAVRRGRPDVAAALLRHGAGDDVGEVDRLLGACARGDRGGAQALLASRPDLAGRLTDEDRAAIVDAAESGDEAAVRLMLELGFPAGVTRGADGAAALHAAAYQGRAGTVQLLVDAGADVEQRDRQWRSTPMCWAVGSGEQRRGGRDEEYLATVRALLAAGASARGGWVVTKPPSPEVGALLRAAGGGEPPAAEERRPADPALLRRIGERLRDAFETGDLDGLALLLDPDVRWGGGPRGCWNRDHVLDWYRVLRDRRGPLRVGEVVVHDHAVEVRLPGGRSQTFSVSGGLIVEIHG